MQKASFNRIKSSAKKGFSLVEMLIVIALIAIVGTLFITQVGNIFSGASEDVAQQFVDNSLKAPLLKYKIDNGAYPTTEQGLNALLEKPGTGANRWRGPYTEPIPADPWGNPYRYRAPGTKSTTGYDLWSAGPDGTSETADDIGNWK